MGPSLSFLLSTWVHIFLKGTVSCLPYVWIRVLAESQWLIPMAQPKEGLMDCLKVWTNQ